MKEKNELVTGPNTMQTVQTMQAESVSVVAVPNKGGRPSKYTPEAIEKLLSAIADGLTIRQSCLAAGIGEQTLRDWQERYPDLESRLAEAREQARQKALACIKAAGEAGDWRAAEAFLRLSFHQDYRRDSRINVTATATTQQALVCDEATRQRLIALRKEILSGLGKQLPEPDQAPVPTGSLLGSPIEAIEADVIPAEPSESQVERTLREMQNEGLVRAGAQQEPEPFSGGDGFSQHDAVIEPWGHNHPAVTKLGLGPK